MTVEYKPPTSAASKPNPRNAWPTSAAAHLHRHRRRRLKDHSSSATTPAIRNNANTDNDLCADGKEVASFNNDISVNSGDQLLLAIE